MSDGATSSAQSGCPLAFYLVHFTQATWTVPSLTTKDSKTSAFVMPIKATGVQWRQMTATAQQAKPAGDKLMDLDALASATVVLDSQGVDC